MRRPPTFDSEAPTNPMLDALPDGGPSLLKLVLEQAIEDHGGIDLIGTLPGPNGPEHVMIHTRELSIARPNEPVMMAPIRENGDVVWDADRALNRRELNALNNILWAWMKSLPDSPQVQAAVDMMRAAQLAIPSAA